MFTQRVATSEPFYFVLDNAPAPSPFSAERIRFAQGFYWPPDWPLVPIPHSWVEVTDDIIFDGVLQRFYPRDVYLQTYRAEAVLILTREQMVKKMLECVGEWNWMPPDAKGTFDRLLERYS